jgi:hypothetical protein
MRLQIRVSTLLVAASLAGFGGAVRADDAAALTSEILAMDAHAGSSGNGVVTNRIASDFRSFAGSDQNATNLVTGLRSGAPITLTERHHPPATFTPPTRPMGYGNVSTSLSLARFELAQQGIYQPTPQQLQTALMGGTITAHGQTVTYRGVLQMRADGMGWGEIAHASGTQLGPIVSAMRSHNTNIATTHHIAPYGHSGFTTAYGAPHGSRTDVRASGDHGLAGPRGVVTAAGSAPHVSHAHGKSPGTVSAASGFAPAPRGQGIVTAAGGAPSVPQGHAKSAAPVSATSTVTPTSGGQGLVTAAGYGASPHAVAATSGSRAGTGVVSASGTSPTGSGAYSSGGGHGNGVGRVK